MALLTHHLRQLTAGESVDMPQYDYTTGDRSTITTHITPRDILVVEGLHILGIPEIRHLANLKLFVAADGDIRFARRLTRDLIQGTRRAILGGTTPQELLAGELRFYLEQVKPNYEYHVAPLRQHADAVIENSALTLERAQAQTKEILAQYHIV